jgi:DNA-directed RNA polymerase subunit omega
LIYPSADTIEDKVGSRYSLVVLAAKRAKQIKEGSPVLIETASTNPLTIALEEIAAGKVTIAPASAAVAALPEDQETSDILTNDDTSIPAGTAAGEAEDDLASESDTDVNAEDDETEE